MGCKLHSQNLVIKRRNWRTVLYFEWIKDTCYLTCYICYIWVQTGLKKELLTWVLASIFNKITGPFLDSLNKVEFSHIRQWRAASITLLTSLKFPFLQQQESQWTVLPWPVELMHVCLLASVCGWRFENKSTLIHGHVNVCLCVLSMVVNVWRNGIVINMDKFFRLSPHSSPASVRSGVNTAGKHRLNCGPEQHLYLPSSHGCSVGRARIRMITCFRPLLHY